jgi:hypothetical protein
MSEEKTATPEQAARPKRFATALAIGLIIAGLGMLVWVGYNSWRLNLLHKDCQQCTAQITVAMAVYCQSNEEMFPASPHGEIAALTVFVGNDDWPGNLGTYGNYSEHVAYYKKHGRVSAEHCPYRYIQGLGLNDPADLIVMYRKTKSHWLYHHRSWDYYVEEPKWLVMGPQTPGHWATESDNGFIETAELRRRIRRTLDFLKEKKRPYWEQTVKEHKPFLDKLDEMIQRGE